jgi:hypothetical protein
MNYDRDTVVGRIKFEWVDKYSKILAEEWAKNVAIVRREAQKWDAGIAFASNGEEERAKNKANTVQAAEPNPVVSNNKSFTLGRLEVVDAAQLQKDLEAQEDSYYSQAINEPVGQAQIVKQDEPNLRQKFDAAHKKLQDTLKERGASYGKFSANTERFHDHYTKMLPYLDFYVAKGYDPKYLSGSAAHLAVKTARLWGHITEENPNLDTVVDTCVDILGYCTIIRRDLPGATEEDYNMLQVYNREPHISEQLGKYLLHKRLVAEAKEIIKYYLTNFHEMREVCKTSWAAYSPEFKRFQSMFK